MPTLIGPEAHREKVANAVFSVIDRYGVETDTLSRVVREADLPEETLHRYFSNMAEMLIFVREVIYARVTESLGRHTDLIIDDNPNVTDAERMSAIEDAIIQLLPLDEERRRQSRVWLECSSYASRNPDLEPYIRFFAQSMREGFPLLMRSGQDFGLFSEGLDIDVEAERLIFLVDGITLNTALHPSFVSEESVRAILRRHLHGLRWGG